MGLGALLALLLWRVPPARRHLESPPLSAAAVAPAALPALRSRPPLPDGGPPPAADAGEALARFAWGSGDGALGRTAPQEGNPEGPMSLTSDRQGRLYVLDQVNGRLVKLDRAGHLLGSVPLAVQAGQDVAVGRDGTVAVLDRLVDKAVSLTGPDGRPVGELPLGGKGLPEGGGVTGLFVDGDGVYAEREHGDLVRLGNLKGEPDPARGELPGRPSRDGQSFLSARLVDGPGGLLTVTAVERPSLAHRFTRQYSLAQAVVALVLLDSDQSGVVYLGLLVEAPGPAPPAFSVTVLCLDPLDGRPLARSALPASSAPEESFRDFTVLDEGGGLYLYRTEGGAQLLRFGCG